MKLHRIPIGLPLVGVVAYLSSIIAASNNVGDEFNILLFVGLLLSGFLIFFFWLKNTGQTLNDEIERWCVNIEPQLYRDHGDKVVYLRETKSQYSLWLRKQWRLPSADIRKAKFDEIMVSSTNKSSLQMIRSGLAEMKK